MNNKMVLMERSAIPHKQKITTMACKIVRIQTKTDKYTTKERRAHLTTQLMKKMKRSGYSEKVRRNVAIAGMRGYKKMKEEEEK